MDAKNVIAAISLSAAVIILWAVFFPPDQEVVKQNLTEKKQIQKTSDAPSLDKNEDVMKLTRGEGLTENERVEFENDSIIGSISLVGATIDDLTFKQYNKKLNGNEKVTLLNPRNFEEGYLIESGFVTNNKNIDVPNSSTVWKILGNRKLTSKNPIKLEWSNSQGITFEKKISLDDQFLFTIKEKVINFQIKLISCFIF